MDERYLLNGITVRFDEMQTSEKLILPIFGTNAVFVLYCRRGRCEIGFPETGSFVLPEGHFAVLTGSPMPLWMRFPLGRGESVAVTADTDAADEQTRAFMAACGADVGSIRGTYGARGNYDPVLPNEMLSRVFAQMFSGRDNDAYLRLKALELLHILGRTDLHEERGGEYLDKALSDAVRKVRDMMILEPGSKTPIEQLVKDAGLAMTAFEATFLKMYGEKPYSYLKKHRMTLAARKLEETDDRIADIARSFGYNSASKFSQAFLSVFGVLPKEYRAGKRKYPN